ncbi:MAG: TlpA disulfide reductase family protein [bacterium]
MKSNKFKYLVVIWIVAIFLAFFIPGDGYKTFKMIEGLPALNGFETSMEKPFYAEVNSNGIFKHIYVIKDYGKENDRYLLFSINNSNSVSFVTRTFEERHNSFYDSLAINLSDEDGHFVPLELYFEKDKKIIRYRWINPEVDYAANPGGIPFVMNPKIILGSTAPDFEVISTEGHQIKLSLLNDRYVLIDFWGTWCHGCIAEFPSIMKMKDSFPESELTVIGLAAYDDEEKLNKFLKEKPLNYSNALIDTTVVEAYGIESFPATFLINKKGIVIGKNLRGEDLIEKVKVRIEKDKSSE